MTKSRKIIATVLMLALLASNLLHVQGAEDHGQLLEEVDAIGYEIPSEMNARFPDVLFRPTQQGIHDNNVIGHRLEVRWNDTVVTVRGNLLWLRRPVEGTLEEWFLIGHEGVIDSWFGERGDALPSLVDISTPESQWTSERERITLFTIQNPDTGLWDIINIDTNEYIHVGATARIERVGATGLYRARFGNTYGVLDENGIRHTNNTYNGVMEISSGGSPRFASDRAIRAWRNNGGDFIYFPNGTALGPFGRNVLVSPNYMAVCNDPSTAGTQLTGFDFAVLSLKTGELVTQHIYRHVLTISHRNFSERPDFFIMAENMWPYGHRYTIFDDNGVRMLMNTIMGVPGEVHSAWAFCERFVRYRTRTRGTHSILNPSVPVWDGFIDVNNNRFVHPPGSEFIGGLRGGHITRRLGSSMPFELVNVITGESIHTFEGDVVNNFEVANGFGVFNDGGRAEIINLSSGQVLHSIEAGWNNIWGHPMTAHDNVVFLDGVGVFSTVTQGLSRDIAGVNNGLPHQGLNVVTRGNRTLFRNDKGAWNERLESIASGNVMITPNLKTIWRCGETNRTIIFDIDGNEVNAHNLNFRLASNVIYFPACPQEALLNPIAIQTHDTRNSQNFLDVNGNLLHPERFYRAHRFHAGLAIAQDDRWPWSTTRVIDWRGDTIVSGEFNMGGPLVGDTTIFNRRAIFQGNNRDHWYFYNFSNWEPAQPTGPIEIIDTSPRHLSEMVSIRDRDIVLYFNREVDFIINPGVIQIREYETDHIVHTYTMLGGSYIGRVIYGGRRDRIILQNALSYLEYNTKYYLVIEGNVFSCPVPDSDYRWFEGLGKGDFVFTMTTSQSAETLAYIAANELLAHYSGFTRGMTIGNHIRNGHFNNTRIWAHDEATYTHLFNHALRNFVVEDYFIVEEMSTRVLVLRDVLEGNVIVAFEDAPMPSISSDQLAFSLGTMHQAYNRISGNLGGHDITLTGNRFGGLIAAYIATIEDRDAVVFNGTATMGVDLALHYGVSMIQNHPGIDRLRIRSYVSRNDATRFMVGSGNVYRSTVLADSTASCVMDHSLNRLYRFDSANFRLNQIESVYTPSRINDRRIHNFEGGATLLGFIRGAIMSGNIPNVLKSSSSLVQGTSRSEVITHNSWGFSVIYTGGATSGAVTATSNVGTNVFIHSGGDAILRGGAGVDTYIIHNRPGVVRIYDLCSLYPSVEDMANFLFKMTKMAIQGKPDADLVANLLTASHELRRDTIYLQGVQITESMVSSNGNYHVINISNQRRVYVMKRNNTPMIVRGAGGSQISLLPTHSRVGTLEWSNYEDNTFNPETALNYELDEELRDERLSNVEGLGVISDLEEFISVYTNHTLIDRGYFTLVLYNIQGNEISRFAVGSSDIFADELWLLYVGEQGYKFYVTSEVARARVEGRVFEEISVHFQGSAYYMTMMENYRPTSVTIDYQNVRMLDGNTGNEISLVEKEWDEEVVLEDIIITFPYQLVYEEGDELDLNGLTVFACYSNGLIEQISGYSVLLPDGTIGTHVVQVTYQGKVATFEVKFLAAGTLVTEIIVPEEIVLRPGAILELNIEVLPLLPDESQLIFSSDNPEVAEAMLGFLYAFGEGVAIITVTDSISGVSASIRVVVSGILLGDINGDGNVNILDLQLLLRHVSRRNILTDERQLLAADVNRDGNVDILDLRLLLQYVSRRIDSFD